MGNTPAERLREFNADLNRTLHRIATADLATCEETRATATSFETDLRLLRAETPDLAPKFDALAPLVGNLRRAAEQICAVRDSRSDSDLQGMRARVAPLGIPGVDKAVTAQPGSDTCETAPLIDFGSYTGSLIGTTLDGGASCGGQGSGDVWYRVSFPTSRSFLADTFGSDFDTVLSVHLECPGVNANQIACNDDAVGLQSALQSQVDADQSVWIRISNFDEAGGQYQLNLGTGGSISGTVTAEADGAPLQDAQVRLYESNFYVSSTTTNADGSYSAPASGLHYEGFQVRASGSEDHVDEFYQDLPCISPCDQELFLNFSFGQRVIPPATGSAAGIDFALAPAARIAGTITDLSGAGMENVEVGLWDDQGRYLYPAFSAADGSYAFTKLPAGDYFISAKASSYVSEVYDAVECPTGISFGCSVTDGTVISVAAGQNVTGIDLQLAAEGSISGTVVDQDGTAILGAMVEIQLPDGTSVAQTYTDSDGNYQQVGLAPGEHLVLVGKNGFSSQYYDGLACGFLGAESCDLASATRVTVQAGAEIPDIDFELINTGRISGTIRDTNNNPLADIEVILRISNSARWGSTYTDALGQYEFDDLGPGTYYVMAGDDTHVWKIYPDGACSGLFGECNLEDGTGIEVGIGVHRSGIDLQLHEGGSLFGRVTDSNGAPLSRWQIYVSDPNVPNYAIGFALTDEDGFYQVEHLPATPVYLFAIRCNGCSDDYINEVYPNVHCRSDGDCPTEGRTLVTPQVATSIGSFDFQIETWATFTGTVYDAQTGSEAQYVQVSLWDESGNRVYPNIGSNNPYTLKAAPGKYTITASSNIAFGTDPYHGEVFDDISCPFDGYTPTCDVTQGTVFDVSTGQVISEIDFTLEPRNVSTGRLISAVDGSGIAGRTIEAWSLEPGQDDPPSVRTDDEGYFRFTGIVGTFTFSTAPPLYEAIPTLFDGILCPLGVDSVYYGRCDQAKGKPIEVGPGSPTPSILMVEYPKQVGLYGYVTDEASGNALDGVSVDIWNAQDSTLVATAITDTHGHYYQALSAGTYLVSTRNQLGYVEQIHVGVACPAGSAFYGPCTLDQGSVLHLIGDTPLRADFALTAREVLKIDDFEDGVLDGWVVN